MYNLSETDISTLRLIYNSIPTSIAKIQLKNLDFRLINYLITYDPITEQFELNLNAFVLLPQMVELYNNYIKSENTGEMQYRERELTLFLQGNEIHFEKHAGFLSHYYDNHDLKFMLSFSKLIGDLVGSNTIMFYSFNVVYYALMHIYNSPCCMVNYLYADDFKEEVLISHGDFIPSPSNMYPNEVELYTNVMIFKYDFIVRIDINDVKTISELFMNNEKLIKLSYELK
ncbi:hypothetical protein GEMRC1_000344 [Eukaryota sp. GEM-RC1]